MHIDETGAEPRRAARRMPVPVLNSILAPTVLVVWVLCTIGLALSGPFGTYELYEPELRFVYWSLLLAVCIATLAWWRRAMVRVIGPDRQVLFDAMMLTGMIVFATAYAWIGQELLQPWWMTDPLPLWDIALYAVICTVCGYAFRRIWPGLEDPRYTLALSEVTTPSRTFRPKLNERLNAWDATIERLRADGHFVEVVTDQGRERLRMRLVEAIEEMAGVEGTCCHRSHWVALAATIGAERKDGKVYLRMRNGDTVPVSRKYQPDVEKLDLLRGLKG